MSTLKWVCIVALATLLPLVMSSCVYTSLDPHYRGPLPIPKNVKEYYAYEVCPMVVRTTEQIDATDDYTIRRLSFQCGVGPQLDTDIIVDYYDITGDEPTPLIMVLPILGGSNTFAEDAAVYFAKRGYAALIVHRDTSFKEVPTVHAFEAFLRKTVITHRRVIDWVVEQEEVDPQAVGVFGISMGGIKATLIDALDDRVEVSTPVLAGAGLPDILMSSAEPRIQAKMEEFMQEHQVDRDELYQLLQEVIKTDPLRHSQYIDARTSLLFLARFDKTVPFAAGEKLSEVMGNPKRFYLLSGHYTAIAYLPFIKRQSYQFFREQFQKVSD